MGCHTVFPADLMPLPRTEQTPAYRALSLAFFHLRDSSFPVPAHPPDKANTQGKIRLPLLPGWSVLPDKSVLPICLDAKTLDYSSPNIYSFSKSLEIFNFICMHVCILHLVHAWYPQRSAEVTRSPRTGVTSSSEPLCGYWEANPGPT